MLRLQTRALVDRPVREIYFGWKRIYSSIDREPPGGSLELGGDDYTLADSYTLADDLTFERSNPDSVWSCFALGRENARQTRHCISAEMWTSLNLAYLRVQRVSMKDIWPTSPESFYAELAREIDTFSGIAGATMYQDEGWSFMQLGRLIERAQLLTALLLARAGPGLGPPRGRRSSWQRWRSRRRMKAPMATGRRCSSPTTPSTPTTGGTGSTCRPGPILYVTSWTCWSPILYCRSRCRSLDAAAADLDGVGPGPDPDSGAAARRLAGRLGALVHYEWLDRDDKEGFLRQVSEHCLDLHNLVAAT